uniref:CCHC-type domain-containing protein n=1 Tax=Ananas comosus var. bracteatus TaxID=296719 RepID=A0A6V7PC15_ANACO|nr:unnamed protein product [Ananas comosus var. bracteatus]
MWCTSESEPRVAGVGGECKEKGKEKLIECLAEKKTCERTGLQGHVTYRRKKATVGRQSAPSTSRCSPDIRVPDLRVQQRCHRPSLLQESRVSEATYSRKTRLVGGSVSKNVLWADEVGGALTQTARYHPEDSTPAFTSGALAKPCFSDKLSPDVSKRADERSVKAQASSVPGIKKTYKEVLLTPARIPLRQPRRSLSSFFAPPRSGTFSFRGRCFRCLAHSHRAAKCREPVRCWRCFKTGHLARSCMDRLPMEVYRAMRARPSYLSAFLPLTDDFFVRQNRSRNAILVDVLPPKNLGHFPQETIANRLASRFGGFPSDFHVARYSERDYVILLPEWVQCEQLIRREILTLDDLRLCCFPWRPFLGARRAPLSYNVWIRLLTIGDSSLSVLIQLERWGRRDPVAPGNHPNERTDQHDPAQLPPEVQRRTVGSVRGRRSSGGGSSNSDASWNSSEIRDRRRSFFSSDGPPRCCTTSVPIDPGRRYGERNVWTSPVIAGARDVLSLNLKSKVADFAIPMQPVVERVRCYILSGGNTHFGLSVELWGSATVRLTLQPERDRFLSRLWDSPLMGEATLGFCFYYKIWRNRGGIYSEICLSLSSPGLVLVNLKQKSGLSLVDEQAGSILGPDAFGGLGPPGLFVLGLFLGLPPGPSTHACSGPWGSLLPVGSSGEFSGSLASLGLIADTSGPGLFSGSIGALSLPGPSGPGLAFSNLGPDGGVGLRDRLGDPIVAGPPLGLPTRLTIGGSPGLSGALAGLLGPDGGVDHRDMLGDLIVAGPRLGFPTRPITCGSSGPVDNAASCDLLVFLPTLSLFTAGRTQVIPPRAGVGVHSSGSGVGDTTVNLVNVPILAGEVSVARGQSRGPIRSSARLGPLSKVSALERAKRRKEVLLEGDVSSSRTLARKWSGNTVRVKSALCGVKLSEAEAVELYRFMLRG